MKKGFTLLEVLIVMAIIGILIALGAGGMIIWRENTEASQATEEILSVFKEIQTKAKNNTIPSGHITEPGQFAQVNSRNYGFFITKKMPDLPNGSNLIYRICWKNIGDNWMNPTCLPGVGQSFISERYSNILFNMNPAPFADNPCVINGTQGIIVENLTGRVIDQSGSEVNCYIATKIVSQKVDYSYFHIQNNSIDRAYP